MGFGTYLRLTQLFWLLPGSWPESRAVLASGGFGYLPEVGPTKQCKLFSLPNERTGQTKLPDFATKIVQAQQVAIKSETELGR